jgi:ketosteroid isomerase-like protein
MNETPLVAVRALHSALETGKHGEELRPLFTEDARIIEHPNLIKPTGTVASLEHMLAASTVGAGLLAKQTYDVRSAVEAGNTAMLRLTWTGVIARAVGPFREGQVLTAHIAQFIESRDGRVASIETFDCYEPFSA